MSETKCFHYFSIGFLVTSAIILLIVLIQTSMTAWDRTRLITLFVQHLMVIFVIKMLKDEESHQIFVRWLLILSANLMFPCLAIEIFGSMQSEQYKQTLLSGKKQVFEFFHGTYIYIYYQVLIYGGLLFLLSLIIFLVQKYRDMEYRSRIDEVINALHTTPYSLPQPKHKNDSIDIQQCSICLAVFEINEDVYKLNCGHFFHKNCLQDWLKHKLICPLDRTPLHPDGYLETQEDQ